MKYLFTSLILVLLTLNVQAQHQERKERIKALKIAFLTEQLSLNESEAEKFWPVYNKFDEKSHQLRREMKEDRKEVDIANLTEVEAKKMIDAHMAKEREKTQLRETFVKDLLKILPAKKVIQLKVAEDSFNRRMLEEFKKRRGERK